MPGIGDAARASGVTIETIRYYEREGVIPPPARGASGRREFSAADVQRLRFVRRCRDLGFPLPDVRALLALSEASDRPCGDVRRIGLAQRAAVRAKLADLEAMETALTDLIAECDAGDARCPALAKLFAD